MLRARPGAFQRWRIVNAAKSRFFDLDLDGQRFTVIGGDGGLQERPVTTDTLLIAPGERVDDIVTPRGAPGTSSARSPRESPASALTVRSMLYNRGYGSVEFRNVEDLLTIEFASEPSLPERAMPVIRRSITPPSAKNATPLVLTLTLPPMNAKGDSEFHINGKPFWTAKPYLASLGETQLWTVKNDTKWDHPFHLHGFFFMVVNDQGEPVRPLAWKDTINIPMESTVRFLVTFDERPGTWMFHCHILDHADGGLMGTVQVGSVATEHTHSKKPD